MAEVVFDEWIAERYERLWPELFDPRVLDPAVDLLAELAGAGPALEFGVGTGRVALPLSRRGILVRGIELSPGDGGPAARSGRGRWHRRDRRRLRQRHRGRAGR